MKAATAAVILGLLACASVASASMALCNKDGVPLRPTNSLLMQNAYDAGSNKAGEWHLVLQGGATWAAAAEDTAMMRRLAVLARLPTAIEGVQQPQCPRSPGVVQSAVGAVRLQATGQGQRHWPTRACVLLCAPALPPSTRHSDQDLVAQPAAEQPGGRLHEQLEVCA
jgi:hypothetical protein